MITGNASIAGVIGDPIKHSLSPLLHNYWLNKYSIDGVYIPLHVTNENLQTVIRSLGDYGIEGINVTVPHKESVIEYLDIVEEEAQKIGAVNTIYVKDNKLVGTNTDAYGFIHNIRSNLPKNYSLEGMNILILGAGGAARAAIYGLLNENVSAITICNRTIEKAHELQKYFGSKINVVEYNQKEEVLAATDLVVNTTSLGMVGKHPLEINLSTLKIGGIVHDIVYNPLETELLKQAKDRGYHIITGIGMLLHQAVPGFEHWFGFRPTVDNELEHYMLEALK